MKVPYFPLLMAFGIGMSIVPVVLLMHGLVQFKISAVVGSAAATPIFGYTTAVVSLCMMFFGPLGGWLSDRLYRWHPHRRISIVIGSLIGTVGLISFAQSTNIFILQVSWILSSFGYGLSTTTCFAWTANEVDTKDQGKAYGLIGIAVPACAISASIIVLGLLSATPLNIKVTVIALLQLMSVAIICGKLNEVKLHTQKDRVTDTPISNIRDTMARVLGSMSFRWLFISKLFQNISISGLKMMPLFYIARLHLNEKQAYELNALAMTGTLFLFVSSFLTGRLADRHGSVKRLNIIAGLILSASIGSYAWIDSAISVVIASCFFSLGLGIFSSVGNLLVNLVLPDHRYYASDLSMLNITINMGAFLAGILAPMVILLGQTWGRGDGYELYFLLLSALALISTLCLLPIKGHHIQ
ncbi:MFS transporter [Aeromonas hydrophila]